jgi:hypothetical protein
MSFVSASDDMVSVPRTATSTPLAAPAERRHLNASHYRDGEPGAGSTSRAASVRPHSGNERTLGGAGRNDNLDESGFCVVDQARYDATAGQSSPGDLDVDAYGGLRVVDLLGVEVCDWYLEELGELLREGGELLYAAVGVVQNRQVRGAVLWRGVGVALAELREQAPGAQDSRRDAAADVARDHRFTKVETEHVGRIDTRVDAAEHLESMRRGKGKARERAACGEGGVAVKNPGFFGGSDARLCPGGRRCSTDGSPEEVLR